MSPKLTIKSFTFLNVVLLLAVFNTSVRAQTIQSPDTKVNLLEVYTSQGCSSCPPAEQWLTQFEADPRLWSQFIPINFHVDYWDFLGWKDPFSDPVFSMRQRLYQQQGHTNTVATPGFMLNGQGWNGWFRRQELPLTHVASEGIVTAELNQQQIEVKFDVEKELTQPLKVHVAILGFDIITKVTRGENKGKELEHDFVVLGYKHQVMTMSHKQGKATLMLPDVSRFNSTKQAVVIWVSTMSDLRPIQSVGDWLAI